MAYNTYPSNTIYTKASAIKICLLICSKTDAFTFYLLPRCVILYILLLMPNCKTFSLYAHHNASLKNTFLEPAFINMSQSYTLQSCDVPSSEFLPFVFIDWHFFSFWLARYASLAIAQQLSGISAQRFHLWTTCGSARTLLFSTTLQGFTSVQMTKIKTQMRCSALAGKIVGVFNGLRCQWKN